MTERPGLPSIGDIFAQGPVPSALVYLGLLFTTVGAFEDLTLANRKLTLGGGLLSFGFLSYY